MNYSLKNITLINSFKTKSQSFVWFIIKKVPRTVKIGTKKKFEGIMETVNSNSKCSYLEKRVQILERGMYDNWIIRCFEKF